MTASFIVEKDSAGVDKNVQTELIGANHAPAGVLYSDGTLVSAAAPLPVTSAQLASIIAALITSGATSQAKKIADAAGTTDIIVPGGYVRKDTLATVSPAVGAWMPPLGGPYGEAWVSLATSLAGDVDSVQNMPVPNVAGFVHKSNRFTTAQPGAVLWTPAAGKIFVVTQLRITWAGATDGIITIHAHASSVSTSTFTPGTDRMLFDYTAQPSTKGAGGAIVTGFMPAPLSPTAIPLRITTSAAITCSVMVDGYEKTYP